MHKIPTTVRDAIEVVKALGERYLWVDSVCIAQDSAEDKRHVIGNMHMIYSSATLTIVAADGKDAEAGLPGLHSNSRPMLVVLEYSRNLTLLPSSGRGRRGRGLIKRLRSAQGYWFSQIAFILPVAVPLGQRNCAKTIDFIVDQYSPLEQT
ncbi:MAG: hypothetical protein M1839_003980 [Geoglossum umbratile]|nr:MAG: hypothetical protein M1839_003980 [Geoglossum umbratile]